MLLTLALLSAAPPMARAQEPDPPGAPPLLQGGFGLAMGVPAGDFKDNVDFSIGVTAHVGVGLGRSPFSAGVEGTYLWYGSETHQVPLVGLPLTVGVDTSNDMYLLHGRIRAQKPGGRVRPYVDGLVGFNYIVTKTSVDAEDVCTEIGCDDDGDSITNVDDFVLSAGGGAGVMFPIGSEPHGLKFDVSVRYLYGGEALYLTEGDILFQVDGPVTLRFRRSRTDMLMIFFGLTWGR